MSIYSHYNYTNALGAAALFPNMCSPATQMIFSGTNSSMNLANWNVFGGYNSYCGGCTDYSNGQILGYSAAIGLGFVGNILLQNWIGRAGAKASQPTNEQQGDNYTKQMNNLAKSIGADNWEDALADDYKTEKLDDLNTAKSDAQSALDEAKNKIGESGSLTSEVSSLKNKYNDAETAESNAKNAYDEYCKNKEGYNTVEADRLKRVYDEAKTRKETAKNEYEAKQKEYDELKKSTEKGGKLYEANEKAKAAVEAEQEHIKEVQDKIKHIRDEHYTSAQSAADNDKLDDLDGSFLGRKSDKRLNGKFGFTDGSADIAKDNTEVPNSRDLKSVIYNYRTAKDDATKELWAKRFINLYNKVSTTNVGKEFEDAEKAIRREYPNI